MLSRPCPIDKVTWEHSLFNTIWGSWFQSACEEERYRFWFGTSSEHGIVVHLHEIITILQSMRDRMTCGHAQDTVRR